MLVSFIVVAYNAGERLRSLINDILRQDYDHSMIEIIFVDSGSKDDTKKIMEEFVREKHDFLKICVLDNPKRTLPCGWNVALKESKGEIILRVDAHVSIPNDFVQSNVNCIKSGEMICGGQVVSIIDSNDRWQKTLLLLENSAFGGGISSFRRNTERRYVDTLAFAAYRREVFETVGWYDERLARTEDNEVHYRMKKAGYKFLMDPSISSARYPRTTLNKMIKQKYGNGYWIGLTMGISPKCFSFYHFVPFLFVLAIIIVAIIAALGCYLPLYILLSLYFTGAVSMTIITILKEKFCFEFLMLPLMFLIIHISYGLGTLIGLIKLPIWIKRNK